MSNIVDYAHTQYYYKGLPFTFADFFHSAAWVEFLRHGNGEIPLDEGIELLIRLTGQRDAIDDMGAVICGDITEGPLFERFSEWKRTERREEFKRIRLMGKFLAKNRCYPYILYPLFNQNYTSTEKAQQLYDTQHVWCTEHMKRPFFMLVFKYAKRLGAHAPIEPNLNVFPIQRNYKGADPLHGVYIEAGNAFWDYVAYLEDKVEIVGRRQKKREGSIFNTQELEAEWMEWVANGRQFPNLLNYHRITVNKQRERARFTVLMEFLWMYLKRDNLVEDPIPTRRGHARELHLKIRKALE